MVEKHPHKIDLAGKVKKGSIILLSSENIDIVGYVKDYGVARIKLSHQDPFKTDLLPGCENEDGDTFLGNTSNLGYRENGLTDGDSEYLLSKFSAFQTLDSKTVITEQKLKREYNAKEGIEGKLNGQIVKGNILLLGSEIIDVVGYVLDFDTSRVSLSYADPFKAESAPSYEKYARKNWFRGDRIYNLEKFEFYKVLNTTPTIEQ